MRTLTARAMLALLCCELLLANTCQDAANGFNTIAASWVNCGGTWPQPGDSVQIVNGFTITWSAGNWSVATIKIANANSTLLTDGTNHTLTLTGDLGAGGGIPQTNGGAIQVGNVGTLDFSADVQGSEPTITATGLNAGDAVVQQPQFADYPTIKLPNVKINPGANGMAAMLYDNDSTATFVLKNALITGGKHVGYFYYVNGGVLDHISWTGITDTPSVAWPTVHSGWHVTYNTATNPLANGTDFAWTQAPQGSVIVGNACFDSVTYSRQCVNGNNDVLTTLPTLTGNLGVSLSGAQYGIAGFPGSSSLHIPITGNIMIGYQDGIRLSDFNYASHNYIAQPDSVANGQGGIFVYGGVNANPVMSTSHDLIVNPGTTHHNLGIFALGNGINVPAFLADHPTIWAPGATASSGQAVGFGDPNSTPGNLVNAVSSKLSNALLVNYGGGSAVYSLNVDNGFLNTCAGAGICGNFTYYAATPTNGLYYLTYGTNKGSGLPLNTDGVNPQFAAAGRTLDQCDTILSGTGTISTDLANRWNGTNPSAVTIPNLVACFFGAYAPTNPAIWAAAPDGQTPGAVQMVMFPMGSPLRSPQ